MKKFLIGTALCVLAAAPAMAAEIPVKAPPRAPLVPAAVAAVYNWTGFYIGIQGGGGWGRHDRLTVGGFANSYNSSGALFGGHAGYNWQTNWIVFGVEGDANWAGIRGNDAGVGGTTDQTTTRFLASARGRLGIAFNQILLFGTAGWGWANLNHNNAAGVPVDNSVNRSGFTVGGGLQWALNPNWSIGAEYRHYRLGTYNLAPTGLAAFGVTNRIDTVTGRISYKFGGPVVARY